MKLKTSYYFVVQKTYMLSLTCVPVALMPEQHLGCTRPPT